MSPTDKFDTRGTTDNRAYNYDNEPTATRAEYSVIASWVTAGARVLDLGCGNGSLLDLLRSERNIYGVGIDISSSGVRESLKKGLDVRQGPIDVPLDFPDDSFDFAICNVTIQMVLYPEVLLREMRRLAPISIVSFANFGFIKNRLDYLWRGRMPRPMLFGYKWYDTGHIHQLSLLDFLDLADEVGLRVMDTRYRRHQNAIVNWIYRCWPNVFTSVPILMLQRA